MTQPKFIDIVRAKRLKKWLIEYESEHNHIGWAMFKLLMEKDTSAYRIHVLMDIPRARAEDLMTVYKEEQKRLQK